MAELKSKTPVAVTTGETALRSAGSFAVYVAAVATFVIGPTL